MAACLFLIGQWSLYRQGPALLKEEEARESCNQKWEYPSPSFPSSPKERSTSFISPVGPTG